MINFLILIIFFSIPFDRHTIHGYIYYSFVSFIHIYQYFGLLVIYTQFFLGVCFYLFGFCRDFSFSMEMIDKLTVNIAGREYETTLNGQLCDIIEFHSEILE